MGRVCGSESHTEPDVESNNGRSQCRSWTRIILWCVLGYSCMLLISVRACFPEISLLRLGLFPLYIRANSPALFYAFSQNHRRFAKPSNIEIVALVPYYHSSQTGILDCYLQRNLAFNGGILDRVMFIPQTNDTGHLEWLMSTVQGNPPYSICEIDMMACTAENKDVATLFVWIDGNVVFMEDHTIPTMVKTKTDNPDSLIVSANVINEAVVEKLHNHPLVALPYLPEMRPGDFIDHDSWRASALPPWQGPAQFQVDKGFTPPFDGHRWLLSDEEAFGSTPIGMSIYSDRGPDSGDWTVKAQQHYSFLHHLELGGLHHYKFPQWIHPTAPISASLFCFMSGDAKLIWSLLKHTDSRSTVFMAPSIMNSPRGIIVDGKGLSARYCSDRGLENLDKTDVLRRYQSYARETVCPGTT